MNSQNDENNNIEIPRVNSSNFPDGATRKVLERAELADTRTTVDLVKDEEIDSYYFRSLEKKGIKLNEQQLKATRHYKGPALVLAGAGSGKTRVLSSRTGHLLTIRQVNPRNILLLTFTKRAAEEMKERIARLPGLTYSAVHQVTSGTYHSIFLKVLRAQSDQRKIMTNDKQKHMYIKFILKEMGLQNDYEPEVLLSYLSNCKNNMIPIATMKAETPVAKEIKEILQRYEQKKAAESFMDFDDILLDSYFLLKRNKVILEKLQKRFTFVLCDEWQDTNPVQYELIKMIALPENNLFVVGDDDQTIFEFNGADSSIILNFNDHYPGTQTYQLDVNYRSTSSIVGLANKVISFNTKRYAKALKASKESEVYPYFNRPCDVNEEAEFVVRQIINVVKSGLRNYKDYAILFRANSNSRAVFDELVLNEVPFITYGEANSFYEQAIVKPVIDYLRLVVNSNNHYATKGVLASLYLNQEKAYDFILTNDVLNPSPILLSHLLSLPYLKDYQKTQIYERIQLLRALRGKEPVEAVRRIRSFYEKFLESDERKKITMHKEFVSDTLSEIESSAERFKTIEEFLDFVDTIIQKNKDMEELRKKSNANVVKLMTIHKSKGLEFPVVYLIGVSEGILPHRSSLEANGRDDIILKDEQKVLAAIESERRLAYVGITRAEKELYISSPRHYRDTEVSISRFIMDVFLVPKPVLQPTTRRNRIGSNENKILETRRKNKSNDSVMVWECTMEGCDGWQKVQSYEEIQRETKECPLCRKSMVKGIREY